MKKSKFWRFSYRHRKHFFSPLPILSLCQGVVVGGTPLSSSFGLFARTQQVPAKEKKQKKATTFLFFFISEIREVTRHRNFERGEGRGVGC